MKIKLNRHLHGHKKGEIIDLKLCSADDGRYWRKAIKDSKIDKSVSIFEKEVEVETKTEEIEENQYKFDINKKKRIK